MYPDEGINCIHVMYQVAFFLWKIYNYFSHISWPTLSESVGNGYGAALWVADRYMLIPRRGDSTMVNPVDPSKVQCTTDKPGVPLRIG